MTQDLDALPLPEPLALLHTGDDFGGERDDPELEFNSFNAATEFCLSKPAKTKVGLHTDDALRDYGQRCYELALRKAQEGREPVQHVPREWRNALRKLAFMAQTSGGTSGPDKGLIDAIAEATALLEQPYLYTSPPPKSDEAMDALIKAARWFADNPDSPKSALGHITEALAALAAQQKGGA